MAFVQEVGLVTTTAGVPWLATSVACNATLTCVAESTVTVRAWPPTVAVAPAAKPVPVTVSVKAALPAVTLAGLRVLMLGVGFTGATVSGRAADVPPPGAGVNTVMLGVPAAATSLAGMAAVSCVDETNVVVRLAPLTWTIEPLVKLEPVAVRVKAAPPAEAVLGLMLERIGAGVGAAMVRAREFEVPPPDPGVDTLTWANPALAMSVAATLAWSWVPLTKVVVRLLPFHCTTEVEAKLAPVTVSVKPGLPAVTVLGESDVRAGAELPEADCLSWRTHTSASASGPWPPKRTVRC